MTYKYNFYQVSFKFVRRLSVSARDVQCCSSIVLFILDTFTFLEVAAGVPSRCLTR
jgi:hypothetical protein